MIREGSIKRTARKLVFIGILILYLFALTSKEETRAMSQEEMNQLFDPIVEKTDNLMKGNARLLKRYYGIDNESVASYYLAVPDTGMGAKELLVVEVKDESQKTTIEDAILARNKGQQKSFDGYGIEQYEMLKDYVYKEIGNYIFYGAAKEATEWEQVLIQAVEQ